LTIHTAAIRACRHSSIFRHDWDFANPFSMPAVQSFSLGIPHPASSFLLSPVARDLLLHNHSLDLNALSSQLQEPKKEKI
jgi:hypothetical protein